MEIGSGVCFSVVYVISTVLHNFEEGFANSKFNPEEGHRLGEIRSLEMSQEDIVKYVSPTEIQEQNSFVLNKAQRVGLGGLKMEKPHGKRRFRHTISFSRFESTVMFVLTVAVTQEVPMFLL